MSEETNNHNLEKINKKLAFELEKNKIFNENQLFSNIYKENKLKVLFLTLMTTMVPVGLAYGLFYEKRIRKIPFLYQLIVIGCIFKLNKIISIRYLAIGNNTIKF